jgi:hypothetical protein
LESLKGRYHLDDLGIDGWIILKYILRKCGVIVWTGLMWLRIETGESNNEPSDSVIGDKFD